LDKSADCGFFFLSPLLREIVYTIIQIMITFHIITIFPDLIESYFTDSILGRAQKTKKIAVKFYNPRDFTDNKHRKVDDIPYGGGPGMVMTVQPILAAWEKARGRSKTKKFKTLIMSAGGEKFTNVLAKKYSKKYTDIILIAGRYEGVDARVKKILRAEEVSIGDYVLTGGELPAAILVDAISRQVPGVLGKTESIEEERISATETYTRPEVFTYKKKNYKVPKVLTSGDHKKIDEWRESRS